MDFIHTIGIRFIHWMQTSNYLEPFFTGISHIGSPSTAYSLTFPSAYYINPTLGLITVLCTASSDWLNGIIKWILHGHRPYWWVKLNGLSQDPGFSLNQYPLTCETGPGSPSGHCMITVASLTPMIAHFYYKFRNPNQQQCLLWLSYLGFGLLGLSRCYLAAHFPHQVVTGIISGLMIGLLFHSVSESITSSSEENTNWLHRQIAHFLSYPNELLWLGFSSFICAYLFSLFLEYGMKLDPNWSINLAQSACARSEWIHLSTSPMMGFSRIAGTTTGLSLGLRFRPMDSQQSVLGTNSAQIIFFSLVIVLLTTKFMESLCNSIINLFTTYILDDFTGYINVIQLLNAFLQAIICPLTTICIVPIFMRLFHHKHDN